jgi:hypothetical protein
MVRKRNISAISLNNSSPFEYLIPATVPLLTQADMEYRSTLHDSLVSVTSQVALTKH